MQLHLSNINTGNNGGGNIRWLEHDDNNLLFQYSDGCFIYTEANRIEIQKNLQNGDCIRITKYMGY